MVIYHLSARGELCIVNTSLDTLYVELCYRYVCSIGVISFFVSIDKMRQGRVILYADQVFPLHTRVYLTLVKGCHGITLISIIKGTSTWNLLTAALMLQLSAPLPFIANWQLHRTGMALAGTDTWSVYFINT